MDINTNEIKLFTKNETNFNHNGKILNEATSCYITETIDGIFDMDLEYPLNDKKQLSADLVRENIIKSVFSQTDSRGEQLFAVRKRSLNTKSNRINIYAQAKARRDLDMNMVLGVEVPAGTTRKSACQMLLNKCVVQQGYYIGNLDNNTNTSINMGLDENTGAVINYLDISGISPLKAFLDDSQNSIVKAYGGEIIYNNFEINMVDERGTDNNILIESGKNLEELQQDIDDLDTENFATAVLPCSADGIYLPDSEIIYSPNAATLGKAFKRIVYDDVTLVNETAEAFNVVYAQLRERVQKDFNNGLDKLKINNTIKYVQLLNTEEYKPYAKLFTEKCEIGNNVTVRYYMTNDKTKYIDAVGRVVKIKFNVLKNRIEEIEIGDRKKKSVLDTITNTDTAAIELNNKHNDNKKKIKSVKKYATDLTNNLQVVMEARDNEIELSVTNLETNTTAKFLVQDGKISSLVSRVGEAESSIEQQADEIALRVKTSQFGSLIEQHSDSIVNAIEGVTNNKTTLDSSGFHVSGGAFDFSGYHGEDLITAVSDGNISAIRIGDSNWSKDISLDKVLIGGFPFGQYLSAYYITYFVERVEQILENHGLINQ